MARSASRSKVEIIPGGFQLTVGQKNVGAVSWKDVERIVAFKKDLLTEDVVCLELVLRGRDGGCFLISEDAEGFWDVADCLSSVLSGVSDDWMSAVIRPPFATSATIVYQRPVIEIEV
jgi:hypothetical protein